jgi:hypothetical protein
MATSCRFSRTSENRRSATERSVLSSSTRAPILTARKNMTSSLPISSSAMHSYAHLSQPTLIQAISAFILNAVLGDLNIISVH